MMKKVKAKKQRPAVIADPPPSWNLGRSARFTVTSDQPIPEFLKKMIVKQGGQS